jgi:two-component system, NtrC family, nitrogen regulation sensor histidine kinase NtrY
MIFKRFLIRVIILVLLISLSGLLVVWSFTREGLAVARFTFILIWLLLITTLAYYVTQTNRTLKTFMESLKYLDTIRMQRGKGRSFAELDKLYNEILGIIQKVEVEREIDRKYFRNIIDHAGVGILTFNDAGEVEIINAAFMKLLGIKALTRIDELSVVSDQLSEVLADLKPGSRKLLRINVNDETMGLSLRVAAFRLQGRSVRLAFFQNIQHELEEEELDAWQKLIRVLTHEIMNSVTPVNSLTNTIIRLFEQDGKPKGPGDIDENTLKNALEGLHSIEKRNKGLIGFVQSYRSLTRIQKPAFSDLSVNELIERVGTLIRNDMESQGIQFTVSVHGGDLHLNADEKLVEQVLINLINNAVFALKDIQEPQIHLSTSQQEEQLAIEVRDNGSGIPEDIMGSIFIPFFTTKIEGSGIGLSLSRQIMRVHGGSISVRSRPGETVFILKFPNG